MLPTQAERKSGLRTLKNDMVTVCSFAAIIAACDDLVPVSIPAWRHSASICVAPEPICIHSNEGSRAPGVNLPSRLTQPHAFGNDLIARSICARSSFVGGTVFNCR